MSTRRNALLLAPLLVSLAAAGDEPGPARYTADDALALPAGYREWVYLSSGLDMSYRERGGAPGHSTFDNVFVDPAAWRAFQRSGHWPDKTVFVMESRGAGTKGSINKAGEYQTEELMGIEVHVRDEARFKGGWGFYAFDGEAPAKLLPASASCYACHAAHGAVDTTFTQFYPTAAPIARQAGTFRAD
jgi:hypothetical protein